MATKLSLKQIADIDNLPFYLKRLGELTIEDNNIVLNHPLSGDTSHKSVGAGFTIYDGDGLGNDITFSVVPLNTLSGTTEYPTSGGTENRSWGTELSDIILKNTDINNANGLRVIKETDIVNGGVIGSGSPYSGSTRELTYLNKVLWNSGEVPSVGDLLPGQLAINVTDGKLFFLKLTDGVYEVITMDNSVTASGTTSSSASSTQPSGPTIQNLTWTSSTGTSNGNKYPAYGLYDYSHTMYIIRADELSGSKLLNGLEIELDGYTAGYTYNNQIIKLAHITDNEFGTSVQVNLSGIGGLTDLTTVKNNFTFTISSSGYQTIDFDTNFEYNGSDNLLIIWENRDGSYSSGYGWAECYFDNTYYDSWYKYQDSSYPSGYGTRDQSYRPNFKLKY